MCWIVQQSLSAVKYRIGLGVLTAPCAVRTTHVAAGRDTPPRAGDRRHRTGRRRRDVRGGRRAQRPCGGAVRPPRRRPPRSSSCPAASARRSRAPVLADPSRGAPADWVLLAVKTHQTAGAADWLRALCGPGTVVAVLQNGVEHRALVAPFAGPAHVLPVIVWCPSEAVSPALVRQRGPARLTRAGRAAPARGSPRCWSTRRSTASPDFHTEAWRKLCLNAVAAVMVAHRPARRGLPRPGAARARPRARRRVRRRRPCRGRRARAGHRRRDRRPSSPRCRPTWARRCCSTGSPGGGWSGTRATASSRRLGARHGIPTPVSDRRPSARLEAARRRRLEGSSRSALTSAGSPRSGNGTSIASKSRGTTVAGNDRARLVAHVAREVARGEMGEREQPHAGVARELGRLGGRRVAGLARARALVLEERRLVDEHVGAVRVDLASSGTAACRPRSRSGGRAAAGRRPARAARRRRSRRAAGGRSPGPPRTPSARAAAASKRPGRSSSTNA